jgi:hypothetical protein
MTGRDGLKREVQACRFNKIGPWEKEERKK